MKVRRLYRGFALSDPGADTNILSSDLALKSDLNLLIGVQLVSSTTIKIKLTRDSSTKYLVLNAGVALAAGVMYAFEIPGFSINDLVNIQLGGSSQIDILSIDEVMS